MNAKQLKESILQYAASGGLSISYRKHENENFNEELLEIPKGWKQLTMGDVLKVSSGKGLTQKNMIDTGLYPVYGGNGICGRHNDYNVEDNTVIIGRVGYYCGAVHITYEKSWVTDNALIVTYDKNLVTKEWLEIILTATNLKGTASATAQPVISGKKIYPLSLLIPPIKEQLFIYDRYKEFIDKVNLYGELESKRVQLYSNFPFRLEKSILQYAMQGKLVEQQETDEPASLLVEQIKVEKQRLVKEKVIKKEKSLPEITEDEIPFDIPNTWEWVRLGDIGFSNIGVTYKPTDLTDSSGIPILRSNNVQNGKIVLNDLVYINGKVREQQYAQKGDILICARNGSERLVGKSAIIETEGMAFGAFMAIFRSPFNKYIQEFIQSDLFRTQLTKARTTTINQITQKMLKEILIPLPPIKEQARIVREISRYRTLTQKLKQANI
ncbi:restriction endonuclease subunit S [Peribacillus frigoritolerans]|uniref:restriction endonuclease subunit S n=1 Tax=Peribacillus frigoritolerans TaxID=450367 RepID=UPI003808886B